MNKKKILLLLKEFEDDAYIPPFYFPKSVGSFNLTNVSNESNNSKSIDFKSKSGLDERKELLERLRLEVESCKKCNLGFSRIKAVFGMGNPYSEVMFVGEGPGWEEDHQGLPFVGRAGQLLDKILASIDLDRTKVYIANIVKCHPMINPETPQARGNDRPPTSDEISACRYYLEEQIRIIKPRCIVALGNTAARFLLSETRGISTLRGRFYPLSLSLFSLYDKEILVLPTYHPAALLRNPSLKKETWEDMKMLKKFLRGDK